MVQLQLYIEGQRIEMFKDESITLTQNITDVKDLDSVLTDYSRTFSVPASKNNNKIFKHVYNYHIDGFNAKIKKSSILEINYRPFKKGKIRFEGVTLKNNKPQSYRLTFFGDAIKITDVLGEDQISTLTELSVFDFDYNDTNISAYMTNGLDGTIGVDEIADAVIFPLITHTNRLTFDSSSDSIYNLHPSTGLDDNGVPFSELKPALRIDSIIKAIELHYNIEFSTDFFNSTNLPYYNLYMWLHTKPGGLFQDQKKSVQFKSFSIDGTAQDELLYKTNSFAINNTKNRIVYNLGFTIDPGDNTVVYNLEIVRNGQEFKRFDGLTGKTKNGTSLGQAIDLIEVDNGEFSIFIETEAATNFDLEVFVERQNNTFLGGKQDCKLNATVTTITDAKLTIASNLPEMKTIDFLKSLFKMFNLVTFIEDEIIVVKTLDQYYNSSKEIHNITAFVDSTQSQVDSPIPFRQVNLQYENNTTFLAKNFEKINNRSWGRIEYTEDSYFLVDGQKSKNEGETYEIKIPFEHMLFERLNDQSDDSITEIQWGWYVDEKEQKSAEKPLLFYPIQTISSISAINLEGNKVTIPAPYMPSNSSTVFSNYLETGMSQSTNFHAEIDEFARVPNEKTLFKTYYQEFIKDLFDSRKRLTKLTAELPLKIHENLSLNDDIKIFDRIYRINSITTNFETGKSELELTNILKSSTVITPILQSQVLFDIGNFEITIDSTILTVDQESTANTDFTIPAIIDSTPGPIIQNSVINKTIEQCDVTAAVLSNPKTIGQSNSIQFKHTIKRAGQVCNIDNIDEFGFLISENQTDLSASDSIETLKSNPNITVINTVRKSGSPSLEGDEKAAILSGLTHEATRHARFYVKTNTDPKFNQADSISEVFTGVTDQGQLATATTSKRFKARTVGYGDSGGYSTIPDLITIQQNSGKSCNSEIHNENYFHNGSSTLPILNDRVKTNATLKNYTGGANSSPAEFNTAAYYALALSTTKQGSKDIIAKIDRFLVIDSATAKVVKVYQCNTKGKLGNAIISNSFYLPLLSSTMAISCGNDKSWKTIADFVIEHNGTGINPETGDQIKFSHTNGSINPVSTYNGNETNFHVSGPNQLVWNKYDYHQLMLLDEAFIVRGIITLDKTTATVVNTFYCD